MSTCTFIAVLTHVCSVEGESVCLYGEEEEYRRVSAESRASQPSLETEGVCVDVQTSEPRINEADRHQLKWRAGDRRR